MLIEKLLEESEGDAGMGQVLDKMTGAGGSYGLADLSGLVRPLRRSPTGGPLKAGLLKFVLGYLFPDSEANSQHQYGRQEVELAGTSQEVADLYTGTVKTAPPDRLEMPVVLVMIPLSLSLASSGDSASPPPAACSGPGRPAWPTCGTSSAWS